MSLQFHQATNLNNMGVTALLQNDQKLAIRCMTAALKFLKADLLSSSQHQNNVVSTMRSSVEQEICNHLGAATVTPPKPSNRNGNIQDSIMVKIPINTESSDTTIVFNKAIILPTDTNNCSNCSLSEATFRTYVCVVNFNLALAYHCYFEHQQHQQVLSPTSTASTNYEVHLTKAEKLYSLVLKGLVNSDDGGVFSCSSHCLSKDVYTTLVVMMLGCINNLSQIWFLKKNDGYYKNTSDNFVLIQNVMAFINNRLLSNKNSMVCLDEPEIQHLIVNILVTICLGTASAAAGAA